MLLWTFQTNDVVEMIEKEGVYICDPDESLYLDSNMYREGYDWLCSIMLKTIKKEDERIQYPVWAWHTLDGKRKDIDFLSMISCSNGSILEVDVPDDQVLLTDFELWSKVLNQEAVLPEYQMNGLSEDAIKKAERRLAEYLYNLSEEDGRRYIRNTWERIVYHEGDEYVPRSIQATFWSLKKSQIRRIIEIKT